MVALSQPSELNSERPMNDHAVLTELKAGQELVPALSSTALV